MFKVCNLINIDTWIYPGNHYYIKTMNLSITLQIFLFVILPLDFHMNNEVQQLLICHLYRFLVKKLFNTFAHFVTPFVYYCFNSVLYILESSPLSGKWSEDFSPSLWLVFAFSHQGLLKNVNFNYEVQFNVLIYGWWFWCCT